MFLPTSFLFSIYHEPNNRCIDEDVKSSSKSSSSSVRRPRLYDASESAIDLLDVNIFDNPEAFENQTDDITGDVSYLTPFGHVHNGETKFTNKELQSNSSVASSGSTNLIKFESDYSSDSLEKNAPVCVTASLIDLSNKNLPEAAVVKRPSIMDEAIDEITTTPMNLLYEEWTYNEQLRDGNPFKLHLTSSALINKEPELVQAEEEHSEQQSSEITDLFSSAVSRNSDESDYKSVDVAEHPECEASPPISTSRPDDELANREHSSDNMSSVSVKSRISVHAAEFRPMYQQSQPPHYTQWSSGQYNPLQHGSQQQQCYGHNPEMMRNGVYLHSPSMSPASSPYGMDRPPLRPPPGFHYPAAHYQQQQRMQQSFQSLMMHQMNSRPHYAMQPPGYYNSQHHMSPSNHLLAALSASETKDFYDFHNEQLLRQHQTNMNRF